MSGDDQMVMVESKEAGVHHQACEFSTQADLLRRGIAQYREWVEAKLGVPISALVLFETTLNLAQIGLDGMFTESIDREYTHNSVVRLRSLVETVEMPPDCPPFIFLRKQLQFVDLASALAGETPEEPTSAALLWNDCPVFIKLRSGESPFIAWNLSYHAGPRSEVEREAYMVIARRIDADLIVRLISDLDARDPLPRLNVLHGTSRTIAPCDWEEMVLDPQVVMLLKNDFEFFFKRKTWFREAQIPHRRGYLLHGPPGNGKSTAIKCMMTSRGLSAYTLRLFDANINDGHLEQMFEQALRNRPSLVVLEDLDRAFPRTGGTGSRISMQQLLNTLDGIASGDGIIVVATANDPALLDPAILRRPGRFDRVVQFPNPSLDLRKRYFSGRKIVLDSAAVERVAEASRSCSFAQLREAYIMAGQMAFERQENITEEDLLSGIDALRRSTSIGSRSNNAAGFLTQLSQLVDEISE